MKLSSYLWFAPFFCFCAGYQLMNMLCTVTTVQTPSLIGKSLHEAINLLSSFNLNGKIVREKIDPDLPEGTVISQNPTAGSTIKTHQSVYLGIVKKPIAQKSPNLIGKSKAEVEKLLTSLNLKARYYMVPGHGKGNSCCAQHPLPLQPLEDKGVVVYVYNTNPKPVIMPCLKGHTVCQVKEFLAPYPASLEIFHNEAPCTEHTCSDCAIIDQRPTAGSIISFCDDTKLLCQVKATLPGRE